MRRLTRRLAVVAPACTGVLLCSMHASADPPMSVWDRAKDTRAADDADLEAEVTRLLGARPVLPEGMPYQLRVLAVGQWYQRIEDVLARAHAEQSPRAGLRFRYGWVLVENSYQSGEPKYAKAIPILRSALAMAPDHALAEDGWWSLAIACGHTADHLCEREAYRAYLDALTEEQHASLDREEVHVRSTPLLNLAETEMHLKSLQEAIPLYRESLRVAGRLGNDPESVVLPAWGLAVALDRSGDHTEAERQALFALSLEPNHVQVNPAALVRHEARDLSVYLHTRHVFFVPAYEVEWYEGLVAMATARTLREDDRAVRLYQFAVHDYEVYVAGAERNDARTSKPEDKDPWLAMARLRLAAAKAGLAAAEKRAAAHPHQEPALDQEAAP